METIAYVPLDHPSCREHRAGRLHDHADRRHAPPPTATAEPVAAAGARRRPRPSLAPMASTPRAWTRRSPPGDNFYNHANGTWAKNTPIPADKSNYGMFTKLDDISRERTRVIIEEQAKDPASKIGIAYNAFLDTGRDRGQGPGRVPAVAERDQGHQFEEGLCRRRRQGRPHRHRQPDRRLCRPGRQEPRPLCRQRRPVAGSGFPTAIIISRPTPSWSTSAPSISPI